MSYQPMFNRFAKGTFNINNNFIGIQAGSEAYLLEDELNELQWIQYEQTAQSNRSILNSGLIYNFPTINNSNVALNNTLNIKDRNTLLWSIRDYVPVNINGYMFRLCGTYKKDIKDSPTNYNNILINLSKLDSGSINELVYLEVWFENINCNLNKQIPMYGGDSNDFTEFTKDERIDLETTQRVQLRWKIKTAPNKNNLSQVFPSDSTSSRYEQAKLISGEIYSFDDNLYVGKASVKSKNNSIDGIYYAIPLFLINRTINNIRVEDITPLYPKTQTFLYNIKSDIVEFGKSDSGIILENINSDLYIKDRLKQLTDLTINDLTSNNINANSITTTTINVDSIVSNGVDAKIVKIFNNDKTKFAKLTVDNSNILNITNTNNKDCDVRLGNLTSETTNSKIVRLTTTDSTLQMALQSSGNELKVKKVSGNNLTDSGSVLHSEKLAASDVELRDLANNKNCIIRNVNNNVQILKNGSNSEYADLTIGNLRIKGDSTIVESETVTIADNILLLNSNVSDTTTPTENSGIEVNRGNAKDSSLIWNEAEKLWKAGLKDSEDVILLKTSPTMDNPKINGLLTITNINSDKIKLVSPSGNDCKSKIDVFHNTTLQSSIEFDGTTAGKKLWTISTNGMTNKIATINANNVISNNIGEVAYVTTQGGNSGSKPAAKGLNVFYVGTDNNKIYYDTTVNGTKKWLDVGRPSDLPDCDSNFAYDTKSGDFSDSASKKLFYNGYFYANRVYNAVYNDYAEYFKKGNTTVEPGDIVMCDDNDSYIKSSGAYSKLVVGVYSDTYGHLLGGEGKASDDENYIPIGLSGRVNVKVIGDVKKGDLLVTSHIPGVAQASDGYIPGTVIGKALANHSGSSIDRISMLIMNM